MMTETENDEPAPRTLGGAVSLSHGVKMVMTNAAVHNGAEPEAAEAVAAAIVADLERAARAAGYREGLERAAQIVEDVDVAYDYISCYECDASFTADNAEGTLRRAAKRIRAEASPTETNDAD